MSQEQGKRRDLDVLYEAVRSGKSNVELLEEEETRGPYLKYYKAVEHVRELTGTARSTLPAIQILWGTTGAGTASMDAGCVVYI